MSTALRLQSPARLVAFDHRAWRRGAPEEASTIELLAPRDRVSVDVGANAGAVSLLLARLSPRVISFEPLRRFSYLQQGLPSNCTFRQLAISSTTGNAEIRVPVRNGFTPAQLATIEPENNLSGSKFIVETVRLTTLDIELNGEDVGFIKIDVEGHELDVLRGAEETVVRCRPRILVECEERHSPGAIDRLGRWVASHGYQGYFLWRGELRTLDEFQSAIHQRPSNIQFQGRVGDYANSFVLLPLPTHEP